MTIDTCHGGLELALARISHRQLHLDFFEELLNLAYRKAICLHQRCFFKDDNCYSVFKRR